MIIGLGQDLCDIRRIEKSLARFGDRFTHRVFTDTERALADRRNQRAATYAKRFAAKEACAKALGTGVPRRGVHWKHMGVVNLPSGRPTFALTGGAAERLKAMTPDGMTAFVHLTITDDFPYAQAMVIIEALPTAAAPAQGGGA
jgi:holo-[acyl-carrier protein] synthase